jgi:hypothetical protein
MKKYNYRRLSLIGVVLAAASVITTTLLANKSISSVRADHPGSLTAERTAEGSPVASCTTTSGPNYGDECNVTDPTRTTTSFKCGAWDSFITIPCFQTANNTTT